MKKQFETNVHLRLFAPDGTLKAERKVHNTLTDAGVYGIMDQILATPTIAKMGWMQVGAGTGGTTDLNDPLGSRIAFTSKTLAAKVMTVVGDFAAGVSTGTITEAGTFETDVEITGGLWMYATFTGIVKAANDTLQITWTLTGTN